MADDTPLTDEQRQLVERWLSMARGAAKRFWERSQDSAPLDELISVAYQGLIAAAQKFEPPENRDERYEINAGFGNYAKTRVNGTLLDWQRNQDHVPRRQRQAYKDLQAEGHGSGRTPEELSDITGLPVEKIRTITAAVEASSVSLDDSWDDAERDASVEGSVLVSAIQSAVADQIAAFPPVQRSVVVLRIYSGMDFPSIAAELGISTMTARTLHSDALLVLHGVFRSAAS